MSRLRQWRIDQGLTIDEVAALTGYSDASISRIERGLRSLRPLDKVRFARSLGVSLRDLFDLAQRTEAEEVVEEAVM